MKQQGSYLSSAQYKLNHPEFITWNDIHELKLDGFSDIAWEMENRHREWIKHERLKDKRKLKTEYWLAYCKKNPDKIRKISRKYREKVRRTRVKGGEYDMKECAPHQSEQMRSRI